MSKSTKHVNGMNYEENPQKLFLKESILKTGIDFSQNNYVDDPRFEELKKSYILQNNYSITSAWWYEKNYIDENRLEQIYGPYAMCCTRSLTLEECSLWAMSKYINQNWSDDIKMLTTEEIYKWFERSDGAGIIARLKNRMGFDVDSFEEEDNKLRLLYLIASVEKKYNVFISEMLGKPSLENVDNSFVGKKTYNGEINEELKREIEKALPEEYIGASKWLLSNMIQQWESVMIKVRILADYDHYKGVSKRDLYKSKDAIEVFQKEFENLQPDSNDYSEGLLQGFYLKLIAHENIGREIDIMDSANFILEREVNVPLDTSKYKILTECVLKKEAEKYIQEHRKELAELSFVGVKVGGNEYRKFDNAVKHFPDFMIMLDENTKYCYEEYLSPLLIVAFVQVYCELSGSDKIRNHFFRYSSKHIKSFRAEMHKETEYDPILEKSKISWIEVVMGRFNILLLERGDYQALRSIEKHIDEMMICVLRQNNLFDMRKNCEFLLLKMEALLMTEKRKLDKEEAFNKCIGENTLPYRFKVTNNRNDYSWLFISVMPESMFSGFAMGLSECLLVADRERRTMYYEYELEIQHGYLLLPVVIYFELCIEPDLKEISVEQVVFDGLPVEYEDGVVI